MVGRLDATQASAPRGPPKACATLCHTHTHSMSVQRVLFLHTLCCATFRLQMAYLSADITHLVLVRARGDSVCSAATRMALRWFRALACEVADHATVVAPLTSRARHGGRRFGADEALAWLKRHLISNDRPCHRCRTSCPCEGTSRQRARCCRMRGTEQEQGTCPRGGRFHRNCCRL